MWGKREAPEALKRDEESVSKIFPSKRESETEPLKRHQRSIDERSMHEKKDIAKTWTPEIRREVVLENTERSTSKFH